MHAIDPRTKPPRAWKAALMTLAVVGLGHFYAGAWRRALAVWSLGVVLVALTLRPGAPPDADGILTVLAVGIAYLTWAMLDAAAVALRCPRRGLRRYNHWYVYVAVGATAWAIAVALLALVPVGSGGPDLAGRLGRP